MAWNGIQHDFGQIDTCLCPLDLKKTAANNGFKMTQAGPDGEFDPFACHWYPKGV